MAKNLLSLLLPLAFIVVAFFGFRAWQQNYDLREATEVTGTADITSKWIDPAGTETEYQVIGGRARPIPVTQPEQAVIEVDLEGLALTTVVSQSKYDELSVGDEVQVVFYKPKYWGDPFALRIE